MRVIGSQNRPIARKYRRTKSFARPPLQTVRARNRIDRSGPNAGTLSTLEELHVIVFQMLCLAAGFADALIFCLFRVCSRETGFNSARKDHCRPSWSLN